MADRVLVLHPDQVWDVSRTSFLLGLTSSNRRHLGEPVYVDSFGRKLIIVERHG